MGPNAFMLLAALSAALCVWALAQILIARFAGDRQRLQQRLSSEWRSDVSSLMDRSLLIDAELKGLPLFLARRTLIRNLNQKLLYAFPEAKLTHFLAIAGLIGCVFFLVTAVAMESAVAGLGAGAGGLYLPVMVLNSRRARRQRLLALQLPDALDFLCRILKAGHSLSTGIQMMGDELSQPIAREFQRCYDQHSLGQPMEEALRGMVQRIDSSDFAFFVTAVLIQRNTGGDLSEVLGNIATMVRSRQRLQQHVKAITAEGRLTGYILMGFPAVMFAMSYALNPAYAGTLVRTEVGQIMLASAVGLQILGLLAIRKIVAVKV